MEKTTYSFATKKDITAIKNLLKENKLPYVDIDSHISHFIVAKRTGSVVGAIGLEHKSHYGLLRSLAVNTSVRGNGIAKELVKKNRGIRHKLKYR